MSLTVNVIIIITTTIIFNLLEAGTMAYKCFFKTDLG